MIVFDLSVARLPAMVLICCCYSSKYEVVKVVLGTYKIGYLVAPCHQEESVARETRYERLGARLLPCDRKTTGWQCRGSFR